MSKKKILLLSDDIRLPSGIGTISKEIVLKTVKHYDWVQIASAIEHPERGKFIDISQDVQRETGVEDASVKLVPYNGYGDRNILFTLLHTEKPDAIFHFTDPRYWTWLYALEHEIKTTYGIPIIYYSIWDDLPYPMWNAPYYGSCDLIMGISKQSDNIHREVLKQNGFDVLNLDNKLERETTTKSWNTVCTSYVPHGLDHTKFKKLDSDDELYKRAYADIKKANDVDFVVMWNNRNIRRKQPGDVILSFSQFRAKLPKEQQDRVALLMHTAAVDGNGTDLRAVWKAVCPDAKIIFSQSKLSAEQLNALYNVSDVVVNIASNEGWGLSNTEAMLAGTPTVVNVTGGLQDQCKFVDDNENWIVFDRDFSTNHRGKYKMHGVWTRPVFPSNRSLQGSPATPYIFDDRVSTEDVADAFLYWYNTPETLREEMGLAGREFCLTHGLTAEQMADSMIKHMDYMFENPKPARPKYTVTKVETTSYENIGIV